MSGPQVYAIVGLTAGVLLLLSNVVLLLPNRPIRVRI